MAGCDCSGAQCGAADGDRRYRLILWAALVINAAMFLVESVAGWLGRSVSLQADALDFLNDALNYGVSLLVIGAALDRRAKAAMIKGATMGLFGLWVTGRTLYGVIYGGLPEAEIMGVIGMIALMANGSVAAMMFAYRKGDSNMRSIWLCARNDAIGNIAVMLAASGVFYTGVRWPDIAVGGMMAVLSLSGATQIMRRAMGELQHGVVPAE